MAINYEVIIIIIFIIIIIGLVIFFYERNKRENIQPDIADLIDEAKKKIGWGPANPIENDPRSKCSLYQFKGQMINDTTAVYADVTLDTTTLDSKDPITSIPRCYNSEDQIFARKLEKVCEDEMVEGYLGCIDDNGNTYKRGDKIQFYSSCGNKCTGNLALFAVNYNIDNPQNTRCLSFSNGKGISAKCDIADEKQLFTINRTNDFIKDTPDGLFAKIYSRSAELYLDSDGNIGSSIIGKKLSDMENDAYVWLLVPHQIYRNQYVPQQMVYKPDGKFATIEELILVNATSIRYLDGGIVLGPFIIGEDRTRETQIINYNLFNDIIQQKYSLI